MCAGYRDEPVNREVNENIYTEFHRKTQHIIKGSIDDTPEPFRIGYISSVFVEGTEEEIKLRIKKFYRPENVVHKVEDALEADLNKLYWSDEECVVSFNDVAGKCYVVYGSNLKIPVARWSCEGPDRFYFTEAYNSLTKTFSTPSGEAAMLGRHIKKNKDADEVKNMGMELKNWPKCTEKLKALDIFAGCGGLSEGLQQSGAVETCWAIEKDKAAADAFALNHPECTVFNDDCNSLLRLVMNGNTRNEKNQQLPQKGEVDLICGGPPCQGFSEMNRFNRKQYSRFQNSLIATFLSYCDYYRPRFFVLENVRNFAAFKQSVVLKLTLRALLHMGYQCTFGVLQAGNYGIPQTRRRLIILAAAPGEILPNFPEPTNVFSRRTCQLDVIVDEKTYFSNCEWISSAPRRTITVQDAISDLPEIKIGDDKSEMHYKTMPLTHFQRVVRGNKRRAVLMDHICKSLNPLNEARVMHIPTKPGADWRDLPNITVLLRDGSYTRKLLYTHFDPRSGEVRGVCPCIEGEECDPMYKQDNTLIPWSFAHTACDHNNWAGVYGRVHWNGFFSTVTTNPDPAGMQGRVLHPEQPRILSVRECARAQGFHDSFHFCGTMADKYRQVGNAVPPPLSAAIGHEIGKCLEVIQEKLSD